MQAAKVIKDLADESTPLDDMLVDAAKSCIVYQLANNVSTPGNVVSTSATHCSPF